MKKFHITLEILEALNRVCETSGDPELRQLRDVLSRELIPKPKRRRGRPETSGRYVEKDKSALAYMAELIISGKAKNTHRAALIAVKENVTTGASNESTKTRLCKKFGRNKEQLLATARERINERSRKSKPVNIHAIFANSVASMEKFQARCDSFNQAGREMTAFVEATERNQKRLFASSEVSRRLMQDIQRLTREIQTNSPAHFFDKK